MKTFLLATLALTLLLSGPLLAQEEILSYHSNIDVQRDGRLYITESIEVRAQSQQINHGIYRDFPTRYADRFGNTTKVGFKLIDVRRNGLPEPHFTQPRSNGVRIYAGDKNQELTPGIYQYDIEYITDRQLGFFDDFDELYFNITGNGWVFPIRQASATVRLPEHPDSSQVKLTGYTGVEGSSAKNLRHRITPEGDFYFVTTAALQPHEGMTIVADWPKGIVTTPPPQQTQQRFTNNNHASLIAVAAVLSVLVYYLLVWFRVGKDPKAGAVYPLYQPPADLSPASMRYIRQMKYDKRCFTAALINLAIKGAIRIEQDDNGVFELRRLHDSATKLAAGEAVILKTLFDELGTDTLRLTQSEHHRLSRAIAQHKKSLRRDYQKTYFNSNKKYFVPGLLLSIGLYIWALSTIDAQEVIFTTALISIFSVVPLLILWQLKKTWQRKKRSAALYQALIQLAFLIAFAFIGKDIILTLAQSLSNIAWPLVIAGLLLLLINASFFHWLKAPTRAGRKLLDKIAGLELYMNIAEQNENELAGQPSFSADRYQQFLPYAFALGVENNWSQRLQRAISAGLVAQDFHPNNLLHYPQYNDINQLSDSLSSGLDNAISSASTAPGTSSGSSGGSSGGGGGGGGGGGW